MILIELIFYILVIVAIPGILNLLGKYEHHTSRLSILYIVYSFMVGCVIFAAITFYILIIITDYILYNKENIINILTSKI